MDTTTYLVHCRWYYEKKHVDEIKEVEDNIFFDVEGNDKDITYIIIHKDGSYQIERDNDWDKGKTNILPKTTKDSQKIYKMVKLIKEMRNGE